jgi:hypothetical protein
MRSILKANGEVTDCRRAVSKEVCAQPKDAARHNEAKQSACYSLIASLHLQRLLKVIARGKIPMRYKPPLPSVLSYSTALFILLILLPPRLKL